MNSILGKIMVISIIVAGLFKIFQDFFMGDSILLTNVKGILLILALTAALILMSMMTWKAKRNKPS